MTIQEYKDRWEAHPTLLEGSSLVIPLEGRVAHPQVIGDVLYIALCDSSGAIPVKIPSTLLNYKSLKGMEQGDKLSVFGHFESALAIKPKEYTNGERRLYIVGVDVEVMDEEL